MVLDPLLALGVRSGLAVLFASAAWHKLRGRAEFVGVLQAYRLLPAALVPVAAPLIALGELAVAVALLWPAGWTVGALGAAAVLAVYALAIAVNLARGRRAIDCGCGAPGTRQPIGEGLLVRNVVLAAAALLTLAPSAPRALVWVDWLTLAGALGVAASVWTAAHGLAAASHRVRAAGVAS
jgi:hypothetical protein